MRHRMKTHLSSRNRVLVGSEQWRHLAKTVKWSVRLTPVIDPVQFVVYWIYVSSSAVNGFLYIALHSTVRRELRRYLPRCRRFSVSPASTRTVGASQQHVGLADNGGTHRVGLQLRREQLAPVSSTWDSPTMEELTAYVKHLFLWRRHLFNVLPSNCRLLYSDAIWHIQRHVCM